MKGDKQKGTPFAKKDKNPLVFMGMCQSLKVGGDPQKNLETKPTRPGTRTPAHARICMLLEVQKPGVSAQPRDSLQGAGPKAPDMWGSVHVNWKRTHLVNVSLAKAFAAAPPFAKREPGQAKPKKEQKDQKKKNKNRVLQKKGSYLQHLSRRSWFLGFLFGLLHEPFS